MNGLGVNGGKVTAPGFASSLSFFESLLFAAESVFHRGNCSINHDRKLSNFLLSIDVFLDHSTSHHSSLVIFSGFNPHSSKLGIKSNFIALGFTLHVDFVSYALLSSIEDGDGWTSGSLHADEFLLSVTRPVVPETTSVFEEVHRNTVFASAVIIRFSSLVVLVFGVRAISPDESSLFSDVIQSNPVNRSLINFTVEVVVLALGMNRGKVTAPSFTSVLSISEILFVAAESELHCGFTRNDKERSILGRSSLDLGRESKRFERALGCCLLLRSDKSKGEASLLSLSIHRFLVDSACELHGFHVSSLSSCRG